MHQAGHLAREVRESGYSVEVAPDGKLKRAMELANKLGARYTLIVGENEIASGRYALKNMSSGEQEQVTRDEIARRLQMTN
jgi:histidyl-tRNA synthetase